MNFFLPFFFFIFTAGNSLLAQPGDIKIPEKDLLYFANKIDSLPLFISSGLAKPPEVQCPVPGHLRYYLKNENLYFSEQALNISKEKKATYIRMYALEALATDLYYKKDYAKSTKYFQAALAIALKNNFTYEELHNYRPPLNNNYFLAGDYTSAMKISAEGRLCWA